MHQSSLHPAQFDSKPAFYAALFDELQSLIASERDAVANMANAAALLYHSLPDLNWAGFYRLLGENTSELVLGPFQGRPACIRIAMGRGVCGAAAARRETVIVPNVHEFPGHIACDAASNAEIVVPLLHGPRLVGVLDLDSPLLERFDEEDRHGLETFAAALVTACDW